MPGQHLRIDLGPADMQPQEVRLLQVQGRDILLVNVGDTLFAVEGTCSHEGSSLAGAILFDFDRSLACPLHGSRFDLATGAVLDPPAERPLETYGLSVELGRMILDLDLDVGGD